MTRAKIWGLTRPEDAALAIEHGADFLGVIFAGGPRLLDAPRAKAIVAESAGRPVFGVFGVTDVDAVLALRDATGICGAQLHGGGDVAMVHRLQAEGMLVWSVRRPSSLDALTALDDDDASAADAVLVEAHVPGALGGTGQALDLEISCAARVRLESRCMVLAGGLGPDTVGSRVALVRPDVADVSSGVETAPGRKDPVRLIRFLEVVRGSSTRA